MCFCELTVSMPRVIFDENLDEKIYRDLYNELMKDVSNFQIKSHITLQFEAYFVTKRIKKFNNEELDNHYSKVIM